MSITCGVEFTFLLKNSITDSFNIENFVHVPKQIYAEINFDEGYENT